MLRFALSLVVALFLLGCGPNPPTRLANPEIFDVRPDQLAALYRTNPRDRTFAGQLVRCRVGPKDYRIVGTHIETHFVTPGKPGSVWFFCSSLPADNERAVTITGTVKGTVTDGATREFGVAYYVSVVECSTSWDR